MASYYKPQSLMTEVNTVELDRALHNLEFEKKQQVQDLEKEKQQIGILEESLKEKQDGIKRMEEDLCRIDEDTKNCHRQFRQNKEQKESQKAHLSVLNFHLDAKKNEFQQLTEKYDMENAGLQRRLEHYDTIWKSYEEIYMQQENAQELMKLQLEVLQRKEAAKEGSKHIAHLQKAEEELQAEVAANEPPFESMTDFIIRIAEIKVSTKDKKTEAEQIIDSIMVAEKEIQTLKETQAEIMKRLDEKRKEEELERQKKEKEREIKEKAQQEELARKRKEEQHNAANSKAGMYKFGQFLHRAPVVSHSTPSSLPPNTTRSAPVSKPPSVAAKSSFQSNFNLVMPRQSSRTSAPQSSGVAVGGGQPPVCQPSNSFLINVPSRSPVQVDRGARRPPAIPYMGNRGIKLQQPSRPSQPGMVVSSPKTPSIVLADTMYNMNIQTPRRPTYTKNIAQTASATPHQPILETRREASTGPAMGPGGDAQPSQAVSKDQQPGQEDEELSCRAQQLMDSDLQEGADTENEQEFPLTPKTSSNSDRIDGNNTPKTPGEQFNLAGFKEFGASNKSPGFSYSCRAMFGDDGDTMEDQTSNQNNNSNFQENPFFSSFFGESSKFSGQSTSQSPQTFGGGANQSPSTPMQPHSNQGGAMAMFGNSPSSPQPSRPQQESMGFSFNFNTGNSPSQSSPGDKENGGSRSGGGFCLF